MSYQKQSGTREELQHELETVKEEYLHPTPDRVVDGKFVEMVADLIIGKIKGDRILELGVGDQVWTPKLVARFPHVTSLDGSPDLLEEMRSRLAGTPHAARWNPVLTYFEDYVPEERFDAMLATYVLEHVTDPAHIVHLAHTTWLKPGGLLGVAVPHGLSLHRRLAVKMGLCLRPDELGESDRRMGHKHCFTHEEMRQLMEDSGFEVIDQFGMITKALPNILLSHCNDAQLLGLFQLGLDLPIEYSGAIGFIGRNRA
jgi:trans-aconitate methyltransferase